MVNVNIIRGMTSELKQKKVASEATDRYWCFGCFNLTEPVAGLCILTQLNTQSKPIYHNYLNVIISNSEGKPLNLNHL